MGIYGIINQLKPQIRLDIPDFIKKIGQPEKMIIFILDNFKQSCYYKKQEIIKMEKTTLFVIGLIGIIFYVAYDFIIQLLTSPIMAQLTQISK